MAVERRSEGLIDTDTNLSPVTWLRGRFGEIEILALEKQVELGQAIQLGRAASIRLADTDVDGSEKDVLAEQIKVGVSALAELVRSNFPYVLKMAARACRIAHNERGIYVPIEDVVQYGLGRLVWAAKTYNPLNGNHGKVSFLSYAGVGLFPSFMLMVNRGSEGDGIHQSVINRARRVNAMSDKFVTENGRPPTDMEMMDMMMCTMEELEKARHAGRFVAGFPSVDAISDCYLPTAGFGDDGDDDRSFGDTFDQYLDRLPVIYETVIRLIYQRGCSLTEAGEKLGFTRARVGQLHSEAITLLRKMDGLAEDIGMPPVATAELRELPIKAPEPRVRTPDEIAKGKKRREITHPKKASKNRASLLVF